MGREMMTVTSLGFMVFLFAGAALYYLIPKKMQWMLLLCLSVCFYFLAAEPYTLIFLWISTMLAYISTNLSAGGKYGGGGVRKGWQMDSVDHGCCGCAERGVMVCFKRLVFLGNGRKSDPQNHTFLSGMQGAASRGVAWHGILYGAGDRVYSGLQLEHLQTAEKYTEAFSFCLLFSPADGRSDQQIF